MYFKLLKCFPLLALCLWSYYQQLFPEWSAWTSLLINKKLGTVPGKSLRIDFRVGLISGISEVLWRFYSVCSRSQSFVFVFLSSSESWPFWCKAESNKAENRILAFAVSFVRRGCLIFHSLYVVIMYFSVYKVPCKKVGKDRFNEIFLA